MTTAKETNATQRFSALMRTCSWLSAVLVVYIHVYNVEVYGSQNPVPYWIQQAVSQGIARGAVPFFMLAGAYFLYRRERTVGAVYLSRAKSTLVPYLLWNAVYMVAFTVLNRLSLIRGGMERITVEGVLRGVLLHAQNHSFWFMRDLIVLIVLYPVIRWVLSRGKWVSLIGLAGAIAAFCFVSGVFESLIYYYLGAWLGYHAKEQTEALATMKTSRLWSVALTLLGVGAVFFVLKNGCGLMWAEVPRNLTMALLLFFAVAGVPWRIGGVQVGLSFMIYALHPLILQVIEEVVYLALPRNDLWMMVCYVAAPILCLTIITGVCLVWKRLLPKTYALFSGGRT